MRGYRQNRFDLRTEGTDMPFDEAATLRYAAAENWRITMPRPAKPPSARSSPRPHSLDSGQTSSPTLDPHVTIRPKSVTLRL
jgi:hypothetical protein